MIAKPVNIVVQAHLLPGGEGFILDVVKLPEAMKLQTENTFDGECKLHVQRL